MLLAPASLRRTFVSTFILLAALAALVLFPGHSRAEPSGAGQVYTISNAASGNLVLAFQRNRDGTLRPAGSFSTGGNGNGASLGSQGALALSADGRYIVAVNAGSNTVSLLGVSPSGLTLLDQSPSQGTTPVSVTIHGDLAYVVNSGSANIAGFRLDSGELEPIAGSTQALAAGSAPGEISFAQHGRSLIVSVKNTNSLVGFPVSRRGVAGPGTAFSTAAPTPFGFAVDGRGRAIVSEAPNSDVSSYAIGNNGAITLINGPVPDGQAAACWVALSPDGHLAFVANAGSSTISAYRVANDGTVSLQSAVAGHTVGGPLDLAVSNDGHYLYDVSPAGHAISEFSIAGDGSLTFLGSISDVAMSAASGLVAR